MVVSVVVVSVPVVIVVVVAVDVVVGTGSHTTFVVEFATFADLYPGAHLVCGTHAFDPDRALPTDRNDPCGHSTQPLSWKLFGV